MDDTTAMTWTGWTEEHDKELHQLLMIDGLRAWEVAALYTRRYRQTITKNAIIGRAGRVGIRGWKRPGIAKPAIEFKPKPMKQHHTPANSKKTISANLATAKERKAIQAEPAYLKDTRDHPDAPPPLLTSLFDLSDFACHWPEQGTDDDCMPLYCGLPGHKGRPYCKFHHRIMYRPVPRRNNFFAFQRGL